MNRLKLLREERGMKQSTLGDLLNVKDSAISKYESEKIPLTGDTLIKLSEIFEVSIDYILGISDERFPSGELEWKYPHVSCRLGGILRRYRGEEISEHEMAEKLNIRDETYINIEIGRFSPSLTLLHKISDVTGYSLDYLIGAVNSTTVPTNDTFEVNGHKVPVRLVESDFHFRARFEELCSLNDVASNNVNEILHIKAQDYIDILNNRMPTLSELLRISYAFNVSIDYLIGKTDTPFASLDKDELELVLNYRDCLEPYRKNLRERAEALCAESIKSKSVAAENSVRQAK